VYGDAAQNEGENADASAEEGQYGDPVGPEADAPADEAPADEAPVDDAPVDDAAADDTAGTDDSSS
jgi:hypothetical protein